MKLTIALLLASIPLLVVGGEGLYHAALSTQQVPVTCEQLSVEPPRTSWLSISGCQLGGDVRHQESAGQIRELVIPVRASGQLASEPAVMIAATRDEEVLAIAQESVGDGRQPDDESRTVMMLRIVTALDAAPEIKGYVRRGLLHTLGTQATLEAASVPLAPGALVLDVNERPGFVVPGVLGAAGALLLLLAVARLLRTAAPGPAAEAPAKVAPLAAAPPSAVAPARLSGLMLLNLDPTAGREAIEQAPPLGPRDEVEQRISRVLEGVTFDAWGRGSLVSNGRAVTVDLGPDPVAWTAVLDARGPGAAALVRGIVADTGWRLYHPKRGVFLDISDLDQP